MKERLRRFTMISNLLEKTQLTMGNSMKILAKPHVFHANKFLHEDTVLSKVGQGVNT